MIHISRPRFLKFLLSLAAILLLVTVAASAQTLISSNTSSGSSSVGPGSGLGYVTWTVEDDMYTCTDSDPPQIYPSYQQWSYSGFVYVDGSGASHNMSGSAMYLVQDGGYPCPDNYTGNGTLTGDGFTITFVPNEDSGTATLQPIPMYVNPKYLILAVTYAPPGSQSNVNYSESSLVGNSTALSGSFTDQTSQTLTVSAGFSIGGFLSGSASGSSSTTWSQEADTSSSVSLNKSLQQAYQVRGPTSSLGIDHEYDVIWLWLNPLVNFNVGPGPNTLTWTGYSYDANDIPGMDVYPVYVGYLDGHFSMPSDVAQVLARGWAANQNWPAGQGPGLTSADFATILAADPFTNPSYAVTVPEGSLTSTDGRFTVTDNQNIAYTPPPPGGNPITQTYVASYQTTQSQGQGAKYTSQQGFSTDFSFSASIIAKFTFDVKTSNTLTWTNQWSQTRTNTNTQSASFSITGPAASDNYTGPTDFVVFQDNVYGTFMFYPVR